MLKTLEEIQFKAAKLSDQVRDALKKAIEDSTFKAGDMLPSVEKMAAYFKVSKVTVREALRSLEEEDLIRMKRGASGGICVTKPSINRIRDSVLHAWSFGGLSPAELNEFRQFVEPGVAELAVLRRTDKDIEALRENIAACENVVRDGKIDLAKHLEFHRLLADACHNKLISSFMEAVTRVHADVFGKLPLTSEVGIKDLAYNKKIFDCLVRRDRARIGKLMVRHFEILKELFATHGNGELDSKSR
jgi:GntR family transcriptional regulator, transcriptional repressor for pyruvate dehydrogenase complex